MFWFITQSWLVILLAFVLGVIVGYWWWRRWWTKNRFSESEAVTRVTREHASTIADKDAEISRLQGLLDAKGGRHAAETTAVGATAAGAGAGAVLAEKAAEDGDAAHTEVVNGEIVNGKAADGDDDGAEHEEQALEADGGEIPTDAETDAEAGAGEETAADVNAEADAGDEAGEAGDGDEGVDVEGIEVPSVDAEAHEGGVDVEGVDAPSVDVTDATIAGLATVPAQSTGEHETTAGGEAPVQGVIDLPAAEAAGHAGAPAEAEAEDDLERIEGIGPRISGALHAAGIHTFAALASSDVATLQAALETAGLRFAPSLPTWARQARFLADGDEEGFLALTESLVAGRDPNKGA